MKRLSFLLLTWLLVPMLALGQNMPDAITLSPANASAYDQVTLTFDPSKACYQNGTLEGAATVKWHASSQLFGAGNWENTVSWQENGKDGTTNAFTNNGDGTYSLTFTPADYFGLGTGETVTGIHAVFNNGTWDRDGRDEGCADFFIPLFHETDLVVNTLNPRNGATYNIYDEVDVAVEVTAEDGVIPTVSLYLDDELVAQEQGLFVFTPVTLTALGTQELRVHVQSPTRETEQLITLNVGGQIVYTTPTHPRADEPVTVTFDARLGNEGLLDYNGEVYAHTGINTNRGDWQYAPTWGDNDPKYELTRHPDNPNLYDLTISPSIRDFYGAAADEEITELAFVFRNADMTQEGKGIGNTDIFAKVYGKGLNLEIQTPRRTIILQSGEQLLVKADVVVIDTGEPEIKLFIDEELITTTQGTELSYRITAEEAGTHTIRVEAANSEYSTSESMDFLVMESFPVADLPAGVQDGINYVDDNTAILVLHAPMKRHAFLIGDFNDWELSADYIMNRTPDNNRYWFRLEGLTPGKPYVFQYLVDGKLRIADPYTHKTVDPWNDPYIPSSVYTDMLSYPEGKTEGIASVLQTAQPEYDWEVTNFQKPANEDLIIYELHFRDFARDGEIGTIQDAIDRLDYIEGLGVNAIELMPINEFEGNDSWGYNPSFYFAPDKAYGTEEDYKRFIDECHKRGIAVIIDMVLNHSFSQSPFVQLYADGVYPAWNNPWYNTECMHAPNCWGSDFDHDSPYTQALSHRINEYWLREFNIDGFRFDFTRGLTNNGNIGYDQGRIDLLRNMANRIWQVTPHAYIILEHWCDNSEETILANHGMMLWTNQTHQFHEAAMGYHDNGKSDFGGINHQARGWWYPHVVSYMDSHDEERIMHRVREYGNQANPNHDMRNDLLIAVDRVAATACFLMTIPGPKMIWQFSEVGYDYSIDFNGRTGQKPVKWEYADDPVRKRLYDVHAALAKLKTEHDAFTTSNYQLNLGGAVKTVNLYHESMDVVVLGNFDVFEADVYPNFSRQGTWYEYFTGEEIQVSDPNAPLRFAPGEYRIYTTSKLNTPVISSLSTEELTDVAVYPNPAQDQVSIRHEGKLTQVRITSITGQTLLEQSISGENQTRLDVRQIPAGIYLLSMTDQQGTIYSQKLIIE